VEDPVEFREYALTLGRDRARADDAGDDDAPPPPNGLSYNLLALDGVPLAWTRPHGHAMRWFGGMPRSVPGTRLDQPGGELA
jgi:hypothetical protein